MDMLKQLLVMIAIVIATVNSSFAAENPKLADTIETWSIYTTHTLNKKECFMLAKPIKEGGNYSKRDQAYLIIRHVSKIIDEVNITSGYKYKKGVGGELTIYNSKDLESTTKKLMDSASKGICAANDKNSFTFDIIDDAHCWVRDSESDIAIIKGLIGGQYAVFTGTSTKGSCSCDIYSLKGFKKAYLKMKEECAK